MKYTTMHNDARVSLYRRRPGANNLDTIGSWERIGTVDKPAHFTQKAKRSLAADYLGCEKMVVIQTGHSNADHGGGFSSFAKFMDYYLHRDGTRESWHLARETTRVDR